MFTRILVPSDGSAESNAALPLARTVARATGGSITVLRVLQPGDSADDRTTVAAARQNLQRIADELASDTLRVSALVRQGNPANEILQAATFTKSDLIIMRTHGRAGLGRAVLGSVTERVLADSTVPVLLVRPGGRRITQVSRVLVPVDGSPGGAVALATALAVTKINQASVRLLEVLVPLSLQAWSNVSGFYGGVYYDPAWDEAAARSARSYVDALVSQLRKDGVNVSGSTREGPDVAHCLVAEADEVGADMIVMSTHALTGVARAVLGSVADAVVRTANCPVLLVRRAEDQPLATTRALVEEPVTVGQD